MKISLHIITSFHFEFISYLISNGDCLNPYYCSDNESIVFNNDKHRWNYKRLKHLGTNDSII